MPIFALNFFRMVVHGLFLNNGTKIHIFPFHQKQSTLTNCLEKERQICHRSVKSNHSFLVIYYNAKNPNPIDNKMHTHTTLSLL
mmetsp:Transcript_7473/g.10298  ORF Transcript_7473/g.10298 Transcript_7473/m.10298 type:complete len:84 (+) Transcript_7473:73-324(+)